jgi:protein TonB
VVGVALSLLMHGAAWGVVVYLLLALPHWFEFQVRRGEAVVLQAQMSAVAATQPEQTQEVEVSIEPVPLEPPAPVVVDQTPTRESLELVPASIPVVKSGEYEPTDVNLPTRPPESTATVQSPAKVTPREPTEQQPTEKLAQATPLPDRQIAETLIESASKVNLLAMRQAEAGAKVDELPRKLSNNREPYYPREALLAGVEGKVMLRVRISAEGRVVDLAVAETSGLASFDQSALDAVRSWRFAPAKRQGLAVTHEVFVPVRFLIRRG